VKLLLNFTGLFNYVLIAGSILCFIGYSIQKEKSDKSNLYLGVALLVIVLISGVLAY